MSSVLIIDHNDSFTENLARYVRQLNVACEIVNFAAIPSKITASHLLFSPGPKAPSEYPTTQALFREQLPNKPMLGVCLGHQLFGLELGFQLKKCHNPMHGRSATLASYVGPLFANMPKRIDVGCYNSLTLSGSSDECEITAVSLDNEVMAIQHKTLPIFGVQFHPESILTASGGQILQNFLRS